MLIIGIKRRFFFGFKKYKVENFYFRKSVKVMEPDGVPAFAEIDMWLVLLCTNGKDVVIPNIEKKQWFIKDLKEIKARKSKPQLNAEATNGLQIPEAS